MMFKKIPWFIALTAATQFMASGSLVPTAQGNDSCHYSTVKHCDSSAPCTRFDPRLKRDVSRSCTCNLDYVYQCDLGAQAETEP